MRDIEFKGTCSDTGEVICGSLLMKASGGPRIIGNDENKNEWCPVELDSVKWYSGINDKTGRKLFEGDKVTANGKIGKDVVFEIVFADGAFCMKGFRQIDKKYDDLCTIRDQMFFAKKQGKELELTYFEEAEEEFDLFA